MLPIYKKILWAEGLKPGDEWHVAANRARAANYPFFEFNIKVYETPNIELERISWENEVHRMAAYYLFPCKDIGL